MQQLGNDLGQNPGARYQVGVVVNPSGKKIRLLLCDDHRMLRDLLRSSLAAEFEIVGEADPARRASRLAIKIRPQVILMDVRMAGIGGLSAARQLAKEIPAAKVLILSQYRDEEYVLEAFDAGAGRLSGQDRRNHRT